MTYKLVATAALTVMLTACDSGVDVVNDLTSLLGAASDHPCAGQFEYQAELNGSASDIRTSSELVEGATIFTEQHWYADLQMIVYYTYEESGDWCNTWNESGVEWQ